MLSEIPGGMLARKYGTKSVFGIGNLLTILLGFLLPVAMNYHLYALIIIRVIQGLVGVSIVGFKKSLVYISLIFIFIIIKFYHRVSLIRQLIIWLLNGYLVMKEANL